MLSPRLEAILAALAPCEVLADVGTHHGLVALAAQERGLAKLALGVDRPQPLDDARLNHEAQGSPAAVKLIAGLGLGPAGAYRPDAVVLAGMGARLMLRILQERPDVLAGVRQVVLQPQTELRRLAPALDALGFVQHTHRRVHDNGRDFDVLSFFRRGIMPPEVATMLEATTVETVEAYARRIRPDYERALREIVEIPTVSPDPSFKDAIDRGADWALAFLRRHDVEAERFETSGYPVVVGWMRHPKATRTLTIYNHLDVQPATEPEWTSQPFEFAIDGDHYKGRGTTDDKGPALAAFYAALMARERGLPLNIQFIWEFEEEIGSPNFAEFLVKHRDRVPTDSVIVSDTIWISRDKPAAPLGLRGMVSFKLLLETGTKDVHSGLAGGAARNPIGELCQLIVDIYDPRTGKIKVPGLVDEAVPASEEEVAGFLASGFEAAEFKRAHGLKCLRTEDPRELTQNIWARPTFEVHGIVGGYMGAGIKAIVPPRAEAKLSMRLVPDLQPDVVFERLKAFVAEANPDVVIEKGGALEPFQGSGDGPYADAVRTSLRFAFGADPAFIREGGSIGAVVTMQRVLGCPIMFIGLSLPEHGYHAPNEFFRLSRLDEGVEAWTRLWEALA